MKIRQTIGLIWFLVSTISMLTLESCYDKCEGGKRTSAEFKVYNELNYFDTESGKAVEKTKMVEEDTLMAPSYVTFEAIDANATSYEWTIGNDTRKRTEKKFTLFFNDPSVADTNPIIVKLKLTRNPDTKCFPDDKGVDSVTHKIYFLRDDLKIGQWPMYGKYYGSDNTDPSNKYFIEIKRVNLILFGPNYYGGSLLNLPNNCSKDSVGVGGTAFEFTIGRSEPRLYSDRPNCFFRDYDKKIGYLKPDRKTIVIDYSYTDKDALDKSLQRKIFTGVRQ